MELIKDFLNEHKGLEKTLFQKLKVREVDEEEPGRFVAYVDEGEVTCDVLVITKNKKEILEYDCDCEGLKPCVHVYFLVHDLYAAIPKKKKIIAKKTDPVHDLLDAAELQEVKEWLQEVFTKSPEWKLSFINRFKPAEVLSAEKVAEQAKATVKSIAKSKKNIDATMLKNILTIWDEAQKPVVNYFIENPASDFAFEAVAAIEQQCFYYKQYFSLNTKKFDSYAETIFEKLSATIYNIENNTEWEGIVRRYRKRIVDTKHFLHLPYYNELLRQYQLGDDKRRNFILLQTTNLWDISGNTFNEYKLKLQQPLLTEILKDTVLFKEYYKKFGCIYGQNKYNLELINAVIEIDDLAMTEKLCKGCIEANYNEEYSIPYLQILKNIYIKKNEQKKLKAVLEILLPYSFNFEDYEVLYNSIPGEEEKKKFRSKTLSRAKNSGYALREARIEFCFRLHAAEKIFSKMILLVRNFSTYKLINEYFEIMAAQNFTSLLNELVNRIERSDFYYREDCTEKQDEINAFLEICNKLKQKTDMNLIKLMVEKEQKGGSMYYASDFLKKYQKHLMDKV